MELLTTVLNEYEHKSGKYPVGLDRFATLLVEEQRDFVPIYMPGATVNLLEDRVMRARMREGEVGEVIESLNAAMETQAFRGQARRMLREMAIKYESAYAYAALLSNDITSSNPAVAKPDDPQFSFRFSPKKFNLGLTGRLLADEVGKRYKENLEVKFDIFDAFNLAASLSPRRIIGVDNHGNETVIHEGGRVIIGETAFSDKAVGGGVEYYLNEDQLRINGGFSYRESQVLSTNGLRIVFSDFYNSVQRYERAILFGHKYSTGEEFLNMATVLDQHLIWDICAVASPRCLAMDASLIDLERVYGGQVQGCPEYKNRMQIRGGLTMHLGRDALHFDRSAVFQALQDLDDVITDIWLEPVGRRCNQGWDIVYDLRRVITSDRPVCVMGAPNIERYSVLKGYAKR